MPKLPNIPPELLKAYQEEIAKRSSPATARRKSSSLKRFFDWAHKEGHIDENPVERVQPVVSPQKIQPFKQKEKRTQVSRFKPAIIFRFGILLGLVILVFLLVQKLKLPIPFRLAPATEKEIVQQTPQPSPPSQAVDAEAIMAELREEVLKQVEDVSINWASFEDGNLFIGGADVSSMALSTADTSDGDITINPDGSGIAHFLFEGTSSNFLNAQAPNLIDGSLYYGVVGNNATGYDLIKLQSGSSPITRFSVDDSGDTYVGGSLNVTEEIATANTTRLTSEGSLDNITGYTQAEGNFTITQAAGNAASITKKASALSDILTLTLDERGVSNSIYSTLTLKRYDGATEAMALFVDEGNARFDGQIQLGRFNSNPDSIGQGSLVFNTSDTTLYVWNGTSWDSIATGGTSPWTRASGVIYPTTTTDDLAIGSTDSTAPFFVNDSGTITFSSDTNLYRSAANTLATDDSLALGGNLTVTGTVGTTTNELNNIYVGTDNFIYFGDGQTAQIGVPTTPTVLTVNKDATVDVYFFNEAATGENKDIRIYGWDSDVGGARFATLGVNSNGTFEILGPSSNDLLINPWSGNTIINTASSTELFFSTNKDTNLFRNAANTLRTNDSLIVDGTVGVGTSGPDAKLDVLSTTEQLRLTYTDGSVYSSFTVDSGGDLIIDPTGQDISVDANIVPATTDTYDLGTSAIIWNDLFVNQVCFDGAADCITNSNSGGPWTLADPEVYPDSVNYLVGIGTVTAANIESKLYVTNDGTLTGKAVAIFNQTESEDILTASASAGTTRMVLTNAGQLTLPTQGSTGGLLIGGDTTLYRSGADSLASDDSLGITLNTSSLTSGLSVNLNRSTTTATTIRGANILAIMSGGSGTQTSVIGVTGEARNSASGITIENAIALYGRAQNTDTGTITNAYSLQAANPVNSGGGTLTNAYGVYIENITAGSGNNYALYSAGGQSYFAGNVGIGDSSPSALLTVGSGDLFQVNSSGQLTFVPATTGTFLDFQLETEWTTGTLINADFASATTLTGTDVVGAAINLNTNVTGAADTDVTGIQLQTPALTSSGTTTTNIYGTRLSAAGALDTTAAEALATNINWYGNYIQMPNIDTGETGDTTTSYGLYIAGGTVTAGAGTENQYGLIVDSNAGNVGIGTTSPGYLLDVGGPGNGTDIRVNRFLIGDDNSNVGFSNNNAGAFLFYNNVGVGDTSLAYRFHTTTIGDAVLDILNNGNVLIENNLGVGSTGPDARIDALSTSGEQLRLTYTDGSVYTGFTVSSGGDLNIDASGNDVTSSDRWTIGSSTAGVGKLTVTGAEIGKALVILDETGNQNILAASASGTTVANLDRNGNFSLLNQGDTRLYELTANGTDYTGFQAPDSVTTTVVYKLPAADGSANQVLSTDASGNLSWIDVSGGSGSLWTDGGTYLYPTNRESARIYDSTGVDYIDIAHDGVDATLSFAGTTALNINIGIIDLSAQTVDFTLNNAADALNFDTNTLSIDALNDRVGIGDISPAASLTVGSGDLFQVAGATGNITTSGDLAVNGGNITSTGNLTLNATSTVIILDADTFQTNDITNTGTITIDSGGTVQLGTDDDFLPQLGGGNADIGASGTRWDNIFAVAGNFSGTVTGNDFSCTDCLDFTEFEDTLDLDAALALNQTTNTWTQSFTGTTTTGFSYTANSLTTGTAFNLTTSSNPAAAGPISPIQANITNANATTATTINGLDIGFTNNPTVAGNTEYAVQIQNEATANITDNAVASLLRLDNADTNVSGSTVVTDALLITVSGAITSGIVDAIDASDTNIDNALNIGVNNIVGTTGNIDLTNFDVAGSTGNITTAGDLAVNGGDITSAAATFNLVNATPTTINFAGVATTLNIADSTTTKTVDIGGVTSSGTDTINIATEGTAADTISIGNSNISTTLTLTGGDDWSMAATGVLTMSASATQTTAIVITDTDYTNSLSIGDNTITGTTASIDLTNFDVAGSTGNITTAGDLAVNGGDITTTSTTLNIDVANTGTIQFRDGTNALAAIKDQGTYPFWNLAGKTDTGDPGTCAEGDIYYNAFDDTVSVCHSGNTWEQLDGGGGGGTSWWTEASGLLYPVNETLDVAIGATATSSAEFVFKNLNSGTPIFEVNGLIYLDGPAGASGAIHNRQGTAALILCTAGGTDCSTTSQIENTLTSGSWLIENTANVGKAALMVNQTKSGDIFTASASGTAAVTIDNAGDITLHGGGTIQSTSNNNIIIDAGSGTVKIGSTGSGKLDAGTIDPVYTIGGERFATYMAGMVGVKEEVTGNVTTNQYLPGVGYKQTIDFTSLERGSDLWLFSKATDLTKNINKMVVLLSASGNTRSWYEVDSVNYKLHIFTSRPTNVSFRLTAPRFDAEQWANYSDSSSLGFVLEDEPLTINENGNVAEMDYLAEAEIVVNEAQEYNVELPTGEVIETIDALARLIVGNIKAGALEVNEIASNSFSAFQGTVDNLLITNGLVSPVIKTEIISPLADSDIVIDLENTPPGATDSSFGKLIVKGIDNQEVASIDAEGNATFSGTIAAEEVESNEIIAGKIYADEIIARNGRFGQVATESISGVTLEEIEELLRQAEEDQTLLTAAQAWDPVSATDSANLAELALGNLYVTEQAAINTLSLSSSLTIGNDLIIQSTLNEEQLNINSIDTLTAPLKIQSLGLVPIEIMAGLITIDTNGNVSIEGNLQVAGNIQAESLTLANETNDGFGKLLQLVNNGEEVASITSSGSAEFTELATQKLIIATDGLSQSVDQTVGSSSITTNATAGQAIIPAGVTSLTIYSSQITDYTLVYVTPTSSTLNKVLYVKSKGAGYFEVGFTDPLSQDVNFNWWIIDIIE